MNSFLKGFFSLFDWMVPKTLEEQFEELDNSMQNLYDRMGWGEYKKPYPMSGWNNAIDINMKNSLPSDANISSTNLYAKDIGDITLTTSKQFLDEMIKLAQDCKDSGGFQPYAYYNEDMDSIEVYFKESMYYTQPLNNNVELYLCHDTNEIVGAKILRVKRLLNKEYLK